MACNDINKYVSIIWKFIFDVETVDFESKTVQFGAIFWGIQVNWSGNGPIIFARALRKIFRSCTRCFSGWVLKSAPQHFPLFSARQIQKLPHLCPCFLATRFLVHFRLCRKFSGVFWYFFAQKTRFPVISGSFLKLCPGRGVGNTGIRHIPVQVLEPEESQVFKLCDWSALRFLFLSTWSRDHYLPIHLSFLLSYPPYCAGLVEEVACWVERFYSFMLMYLVKTVAWLWQLLTLSSLAHWVAVCY